MDIQEIKRRKEEMESDIADILNRFMANTELNITSVSIESLVSMMGLNTIIKFNCEIRL